jgi:hypothetical protein
VSADLNAHVPNLRQQLDSLIDAQPGIEVDQSPRFRVLEKHTSQTDSVG